MIAKKAPFRILWSNDTTHILSCYTPYRRDRSTFTADKMVASIDEVTGIGVDVQMLQPGFGWIPWYESTFYTRADHARWFEQRFPRKDPDPFTKYWLEGGDIVGDFVARCKEREQACFVSMRMNHSPFPGREEATSSRFYDEHPDYRTGPAPKWVCSPNWAIPEVREHRFTQIREMCERYDLDGFELDFMRYPLYFDPKATDPMQRRAIMTQFVARVRRLLDRTAKPGRRRWLCVRVPSEFEPHGALGIDLRAMVDAGVDMVNLSCYYFTQQQSDLARICAMLPGVPVYLEVTYCSSRNTTEGQRSGVRRLSTDHQLYTAAHLARQRGAQGMSLFNFVYYRHYRHEPPLAVIERMRDPKWLAEQPQWYFLDAHGFKYWQSDYRGPLPQEFAPAQTHAFSLDMAPTARAKQGLLRLMATEDMAARDWSAKMNDTPLAATESVPAPLAHPYTSAIGKPSQYACFVCPPAWIKNGTNRIEITLRGGKAMTLRYLDLMLW
ncbi:MAG: hypothetical protein HN849_25280 [Victivallales bacterium]|nr:hypothetical protein [Victivallales bacterium]